MKKTTINIIERILLFVVFSMVILFNQLLSNTGNKYINIITIIECVIIMVCFAIISVFNSKGGKS